MKRTLFLSLLALALFLLAACGSSTGGQGQGQSSSNKNQQSATPTTPATQPTETPKPTFFKVGQVVTISKVVQITVTRVQHLPLSKTEPGYTPEKAPADGEFLVISVVMANLGVEPLQVSGFDYGLRDAEGETPSAWIWGVQGTDGPPTGTAPAGQKIKGDITFITRASVHPYFFSFESPRELPHALFWQID